MIRDKRPETGDQTDLDGILVIDKPANLSSARVVAAVKKALKAGKAGHAGTLDPFAEGVLICCINQATRLAGFLLHGTKKYIAELKLGQETDTQDLTGTVVATANTVDYSPQTIQSVFESFKGSIEQLPPVYSALKHKGVPLYKLARRGQPVQKPPRQVQIYDICVDDVDLPYVRFEVSCSAGTYIRTLGADIGQKAGLRRPPQRVKTDRKQWLYPGSGNTLIRIARIDLQPERVIEHDQHEGCIAANA